MYKTAQLYNTLETGFIRLDRLSTLVAFPVLCPQLHYHHILTRVLLYLFKDVSQTLLYCIKTSA
jgi:hypothetical protein